MRNAATLLIALFATAAPAAPPPNTYDEQLRALDPLVRRSVMRRAILDDGGQCGRVVRTIARGSYGNLRMWEAQCDRGGAYAVFIGPDSSVQVRECGTLASLKLPRCTLPPPKPAH